MWRRRQYGETARLGSDLARRRSDLRDLWRLRLRQGIRHRAQMARGPPLPDGTHLYKPDPCLYRPARVGNAAVLLSREPRTNGQSVVSNRPCKPEHDFAAHRLTGFSADEGRRL